MGTTGSLTRAGKDDNLHHGLVATNKNTFLGEPLLSIGGSLITTSESQINDNVFPKFDTGSFGTDYTVTSLGTGDLLSYEGNIDGASYLKISKSPFLEGETIITSISTIKPPFLITSGITISQKLVGVSVSTSAIGVDSDKNVDLTTRDSSVPIAITSATLSGNGTLLTIVTPTPHGILARNRLCLSGFAFSRINVGPVFPTTILSRTSFTITTSTGAGFDGVHTDGVVNLEAPARGKNEAGFLFDTNSTTTAINYTRANNGSVYQNNAYSLTSHAPVYTSSNTRYAQGILSTGEYGLSVSEDQAYFTHNVVNNTASQTLGNKQQNQTPETNVDYKSEVRAVNLPNFSRPIARVALASKSGTTTATITTDAPHGLTNSSYVIVAGCVDAANFPSQVTATAIVVLNATQFTTVITGAVTAATTGGAVFLMHGVSTIANQTSSVRVAGVSASDNELLVNMSASAAALFGIGDSVNFYGASPSTGLLPYEGAYLVADILTTTPFTVTLIPTLGSPTITDIALVATGGLLIRRTDVLFHWLKGETLSKQAVEITGMSQTGDATQSLKASVLNTVAVSGTVTANVVGQAAHSAASTGSPVRIGARVVTTQDTTLATSDTSDLVTDQNSALIIKPFSVSDLTWTYPSASGGITNTTDVAIKAAAGAGISNYIVAIQISNASIIVATEVVIKDGATVKERIHCPASMPNTNITFPIPIKGSAATALNVACITTGAAVYVNAQGYTGI